MRWLLSGRELNANENELIEEDYYELYDPRIRAYKIFPQEMCNIGYSAAQKCCITKEFKNLYPFFHAKAERYKWIKDYTWLIRHKPDWDYDSCREAALSCRTKEEFRTKYGGAYSKACKNGWLKEYEWLERKQKYSYEECLEAAIKCKTRQELQDRFPWAYGFALRRKWLDDFGLPKKGEIRRIIYSVEELIYAADTCETRSEFAKKFPSQYGYAIRNNLMDELFDHRKINYYDGNIDSVYAYIFKDYNAVYVGRSVNLYERNIDHTTSDKSAVFRFAKEVGCDIPEMTVLETGLTLLDGCEREDYYVNYYKEQGFNVLNKQKTGRYCGGIGTFNRKWSKKKCEKVARECSTMKEFREEHSDAFWAARRHKWIDSFTWLAKDKSEHVSRSHAKQVMQISPTGEVVAHYNSIQEAAGSVGVSRGSISDCLRGNTKTCAGYKWEYEKNKEL